MTATGVTALTFTRRVGAGGEAEVYEVAERPGVVCKHYRSPTRERADKLRVMLEHPPDGTRAGGHVSIAWPTELAVGDDGRVTGFLMPRIDVSSAIPVFQVYNPGLRGKVAPGFTWRYLLRTARNVAAIVDAVHRAGHVVGDLNESNLLVDRRALVALVDCDSMQICDPSSGRIYRSPVGKPEFLAPELQGADLSATDRTPRSDAFALTVLMHQLLLEGVHPHAGIWRGRGEPPDIATRSRKGWIAGRRGWSPVDQPPYAVPRAALPRPVRTLLRRGLARRAGARAEAWEWVAVLDAVDGKLRACKRSPHHLHATRRCPWCARIDRGLPDPFPGPTGTSTLPPRQPSRAVRWGKRLPARGLATLHRARVGALAGGFAVLGWAFPVAIPVVLALVALPAVYALATPSRHVLKALAASARAFVTSAGASAGVAAMFVGWPNVVRVASALAAVVHGVLLPASLTPWAAARQRLARLPGVLPWLLAAASVAAWRLAGW